MSHSSLVRVNQKLAHAKFLIDLAQQQSNELTSLQNSSYLEAICFHLYCAYQFYLQEIAETYHLKNIQDLKTEAELIRLFESKNKFPVEAQELQQLRQLPESWLSLLCIAYQELWQPSRSGVLKNSDDSQNTASENLISVVHLDQQAPELSLAQIESWQKEFRALVLRQRDTSTEF